MCTCTHCALRQAEALLGAALERNAVHPEAHLFAALAAARRGDDAAALPLLARAHGLAPHHAEITRDYGAVLFRLDRIALVIGRHSNLGPSGLRVDRLIPYSHCALSGAAAAAPRRGHAPRAGPRPRRPRLVPAQARRRAAQDQPARRVRARRTPCGRPRGGGRRAHRHCACGRVRGRTASRAGHLECGDRYGDVVR